MSLFNWNKHEDNPSLDEENAPQFEEELVGKKASSSQDITFASYVNTFLTDVNTAGLDTQKDKDVLPFSTAATQQAVSMMGEDARSYLQGMELIYTAATAKGLEMVAEENPQGEKLLTAVTTSQLATGTFSVSIAACAEAFAKL